MLASVTNQNDFTRAVSSGKTIVVDFWAEWCHSCHNLEPVLDKLSGHFKGKAEFMKVNGDDNPELTEEYGVSAYPTILIFKGGEVVEQIVGAYPESTLKELIENHV